MGHEESRISEEVVGLTKVSSDEPMTDSNLIVEEPKNKYHLLKHCGACFIPYTTHTYQVQMG